MAKDFMDSQTGGEGATLQLQDNTVNNQEQYIADIQAPVQQSAPTEPPPIPLATTDVPTEQQSLEQEPPIPQITEGEQQQVQYDVDSVNGISQSLDEIDADEPIVLPTNPVEEIVQDFGVEINPQEEIDTIERDYGTKLEPMYAPTQTKIPNQLKPVARQEPKSLTYPKKPENEYRVVNGFYQKRVLGTDNEWFTIENEGSVNALNKHNKTKAKPFNGIYSYTDPITGKENNYEYKRAAGKWKKRLKGSDDDYYEVTNIGSISALDRQWGTKTKHPAKKEIKEISSTFKLLNQQGFGTPERLGIGADPQSFYSDGTPVVDKTDVAGTLFTPKQDQISITLEGKDDSFYQKKLSDIENARELELKYARTPQQKAQVNATFNKQRNQILSNKQVFGDKIILPQIPDDDKRVNKIKSSKEYIDNAVKVVGIDLDPKGLFKDPNQDIEEKLNASIKLKKLINEGYVPQNIAEAKNFAQKDLGLWETTQGVVLSKDQRGQVRDYQKDINELLKDPINNSKKIAQKNDEIKKFIETSQNINNDFNEASQRGMSIDALMLEKKIDSVRHLKPSTPITGNAMIDGANAIMGGYSNLTQSDQYTKVKFDIHVGMYNFMQDYIDSGKIKIENGKINVNIKDPKELKYVQGKLSAFQQTLDTLDESVHNTISDDILRIDEKIKRYDSGIHKLENKIDNLDFDITKGESINDIIDFKNKLDIYKNKRDFLISEKKKLSENKRNFFLTNPKETAKTVAGFSTPSLKAIWNNLPKGITSKQKFDIFYFNYEKDTKDFARKNQIDEGILDKYGQKFRDALDIETLGLNLTNEEKEYFKRVNVLNSLKSAYLNNDLGFTKESAGFWDSVVKFWDSVVNSIGKELKPTTYGAEGFMSETEKAQIIKGTLQEQGFTKKDLTAYTKLQDLKDRGEYHWASAEGFGNMTGMSLAIVGKIVASTPALGAPMSLLRNGIRLTGLIDKSLDTKKVIKGLEQTANSFDDYLFNSTKLGRYTREGLKQGTQFEMASYLFNDPNGELDFANGMIGLMGSKAIIKLYSKTKAAVGLTGSIFSKSAPKAVQLIKNIGARGAAEVPEESLQELTSIYNDELRTRGFWDEVKNRYGDFDDVMQLVVSSFILGGAFGLGTSQSVSDAYDNLEPKKQQQIKDVVEEVQNDIDEANVHADETAEMVADNIESEDRIEKQPDEAPKEESASPQTEDEVDIENIKEFSFTPIEQAAKEEVENQDKINNEKEQPIEKLNVSTENLNLMFEPDDEINIEQIQKPSVKEQNEDIQSGHVSNFEYKTLDEVPSYFKDKVGVIVNENNEKTFWVSVPQSLLDYYLKLEEQGVNQTPQQEVVSAVPQESIQGGESQENVTDEKKTKARKQSRVTEALVKAESKISSFNNSLKKFGNETLGINIPVAVLQGAMQVGEDSIKAARKFSEAIDDAIEYIKNTDWFKGLSKDIQDAEIKDVKDMFLEDKPMHEVLGISEEEFNRVIAEYDRKAEEAKANELKTEEAQKQTPVEPTKGEQTDTTEIPLSESMSVQLPKTQTSTEPVETTPRIIPENMSKKAEAEKELPQGEKYSTLAYRVSQMQTQGDEIAKKVKSIPTYKTQSHKEFSKKIDEILLQQGALEAIMYVRSATESEVGRDVKTAVIIEGAARLSSDAMALKDKAIRENDDELLTIAENEIEYTNQFLHEMSLERSKEGVINSYLQEIYKKYPSVFSMEKVYEFDPNRKIREKIQAHISSGRHGVLNALGSLVDVAFTDEVIDAAIKKVTNKNFKKKAGETEKERITRIADIKRQIDESVARFKAASKKDDGTLKSTIPFLDKIKKEHVEEVVKLVKLHLELGYVGVSHIVDTVFRLIVDGSPATREHVLSIARENPQFEAMYQSELEKSKDERSRLEKYKAILSDLEKGIPREKRIKKDYVESDEIKEVKARISEIEKIQGLQKTLSDLEKGIGENTSMGRINKISDEIQALRDKINKERIITNQSIREAVKDHYKGKSRYARTLADAIVAKTNLDKEQAQVLADELEGKINDKVEKIVQKQQQKVIDDIAKKEGMLSTDALKEKQIMGQITEAQFEDLQKRINEANNRRETTKIMKLIKLGGITDANEFTRAFEKRFGFRNIPTTKRKQIDALASQIFELEKQLTKEVENKSGLKKTINIRRKVEIQRLQLKINTILESAKPWDFPKIARAIHSALYVAILSDILTLFRAGLGGYGEAIWGSLMYAINNVATDHKALFKGWEAGFKAVPAAWRKAAIARKTGFDFYGEAGLKADFSTDSRGNQVKGAVEDTLLSGLGEALSNKKYGEAAIKTFGQTFKAIHVLGALDAFMNAIAGQTVGTTEAIKAGQEVSNKFDGEYKKIAEDDFDSMESRIREMIDSTYPDYSKAQKDKKVNEFIRAEMGLTGSRFNAKKTYMLARVQELKENELGNYFSVGVQLAKDVSLVANPDGILGYVFSKIQKLTAIKETDSPFAVSSKLLFNLTFKFLRLSVNIFNKAKTGIPILGAIDAYFGVGYDPVSGEFLKKIQGKRYANPLLAKQRLTSNLVTSALALGGLMLMMEWDDDKKKYVLRKDRPLDIRGFGEGYSENQRAYENYQNLSFSFSKNKDGKFDNYISVKLLPSMQSILANMTGFTDLLHEEAGEKYDKRPIQYSNWKGLWGAVGNNLRIFTDDNISSIGRMSRDWNQEPDNNPLTKFANVGFGVLRDNTKPILNPLVIQGIFTGIESAYGKTEKDASGDNKFFKTFAKNFYGLDGVIDKNKTDVFGNTYSKESNYSKFLRETFDVGEKRSDKFKTVGLLYKFDRGLDITKRFFNEMGTNSETGYVYTYPIEDEADMKFKIFSLDNSVRDEAQKLQENTFRELVLENYDYLNSIDNREDLQSEMKYLQELSAKYAKEQVTLKHEKDGKLDIKLIE